MQLHRCIPVVSPFRLLFQLRFSTFGINLFLYVFLFVTPDLRSYFYVVLPPRVLMVLRASLSRRLAKLCMLLSVVIGPYACPFKAYLRSLIYMMWAFGIISLSFSAHDFLGVFDDVCENAFVPDFCYVGTHIYTANQIIFMVHLCTPSACISLLPSCFLVS